MVYIPIVFHMGCFGAVEGGPNRDADFRSSVEKAG